MSTFKNLKALSASVVLAIALTGCGKDTPSYSILPSSQSFKQSNNILTNQLDILWVVDNSGSMDPLQSNLVSNFSSFISSFQTKGYDFKMAVTTSDAYLANPLLNNTPSQAKFRDGLTTHTGVFVMLPTTPNLNNVFVTDATQGSAGSGDERAFSSFREALNSPLNAGFLRATSYLAVIILSDEDDFSGNTRAEYGGTDHNYAASTLETVDSYVSYLDTLTGTTGASRRYNVSAITVKDSACLASHGAVSPSTIMGTRYIDIATKTSGVTGSICDASYAAALNSIQSNIAELSTQFYLGRIPIVSSIAVQINGSTIPNNAINGWTYNAASNSVVFHGSFIPPQNAIINVYFVPATIN